MTLAAGWVLLVVLVGLALFASERWPVDVSALVLLLMLMLPGVITPAEALAGFGSETVAVLVALFVITGAITHTGVITRIGVRLGTLSRSRPKLLIHGLLLACTTVSAFLSNTVTTAVLLPLVLGTTRRANIPPSRVLMPLAYASILSGGVTVVSTSTNIVVSGELVRMGLPAVGFFEMAPVGLAVTLVGMLYLLLVAPHLIPERGSPDVLTRYDLRRYLSEVLVTPTSKLVGRSLRETRFGEVYDLRVLAIRRQHTRLLVPRPDAPLQADDVLLVEGSADDILLVKDRAGLEIKPDFELSDPDLVSEQVRMVEVMVLPRSHLVGQTLKESAFRDRTGLTVLAIHTPEQEGARVHLSNRPLEAGDMMLVQGPSERLRGLDHEGLLMLDDKSAHHPRKFKGRIALLVFVGCVLLTASGALPMAVAFLTGVPVLLLTGCLTPSEAYESVDWRLIIMLGCMMALGAAMTHTGAAALLADLIVDHVSPWGPTVVLASIFALTVALTQPMSNQAAALVVLPVAVQVAQALSLEPRPFAMTVMLAASCSFLTPLEPSCLLVYGPGRYRFFDFVRVGGLLTVLVFLVCMWLIPWVWPVVART